MYEAHWQLDSRPFESAADPRFYYPSEVHQGALLKLRYAVENRRGGALVCGAAGSGKTLVLHTLRRLLPEQFSPLVYLAFPLMSERELLAWLADELYPQPAGPVQGLDQNLRRIERSLIDNAAAGRQAVLVLDEAHLLVDRPVIETVRLLLNFEDQGQPLLTLLLVGQPALLPALDRLPGFEERLDVKCLLRAFTPEETAAYVQHRMQAAGAREDVFRSDALEALHQLTRGNPRRINRLCDLALLIGYAEDQAIVTASHLEAVSSELTAVVPE
jgi:general secretion pathway protein A